jgi:hypothetical protein
MSLKEPLEWVIRELFEIELDSELLMTFDPHLKLPDAGSI